MTRKISCLVIACAAICALCGPTQAKAAAPYYEGKTVTMIVGFSPGGGYDRLSRILAKHMPKYIPLKPAIIAQNVPCAGTMIAANQTYNMTKPDGLTF